MTYHQHMNLIDYGGGNKAAQSNYAKQTEMKFTRLPSYPGSQATWLHAAYPDTTVLTVKLPARVPTTTSTSRLLKYLAVHHACP